MAATIRKKGLAAWRQLADVLRERIRAGEFLPGHPLPSEQQLQDQYQVSRGPARRAISLLRDEGLVVTIAGRGSFVADPLPDPELGQHHDP